MKQSTSTDFQRTREAIVTAIETGDFSAARALLATLDGYPLDPASAGAVVSLFQMLRDHLPLLPFRLATIGSFHFGPMDKVLRALAFQAGIDLTIGSGSFGTYAQDLLDAHSWLSAFAPDAVFLAVQARDLAPALWDDFADLDESQVRGYANHVIDTHRQLLTAYRSRHAAPLVVCNFQLPTEPSNGIFDAQQAERGQVATFARLNQQLAQLVHEFRNVYVLDYDGLIRRRGSDAFHSASKMATMRTPIAGGEWFHLARECLRFLCPLSGRICKVLAVDLDNTLWKGVVGEHGFNRLFMSDGVGAAHRAVQRAMLDLHRRGILLAVCSKNNPAEALDVIDRHPDMLLRRAHFAALRINWVDKAQNLREIAAELNIGVDAIAFLDDNPAERDWVRRQLPDVTVIELPADPFGFAPTLRTLPQFERLELSSADHDRGRFYQEQQKRTEFKAGASSLEDFYVGLQMRVEIAPLAAATLPRAAQLTQKTNQFNLTTRRYTEEQLSRMQPPEWGIYTLAAKDRFGDNGIVGVAILKFEGNVAEINTLLLSCRVIGRTIETAFLAALAKLAGQRGATKLVGRYIPSLKNEPAKDVYRSHGFTLSGENDGGTRWEIALPAKNLACPEWIDCQISTNESATS